MPGHATNIIIWNWRKGLEALGLRFVVKEQDRLPQLNAIYIPDGVDDTVARRSLLEGLRPEIGAGLGAMTGKIWRIGLMGHAANERNVNICLTALEDVMR